MVVWLKAWTKIYISTYVCANFGFKSSKVYSKIINKYRLIYLLLLDSTKRQYLIKLQCPTTALSVEGILNCFGSKRCSYLLNTIALMTESSELTVVLHILNFKRASEATAWKTWVAYFCIFCISSTCTVQTGIISFWRHFIYTCLSIGFFVGLQSKWK